MFRQYNFFCEITSHNLNLMLQHNKNISLIYLVSDEAQVSSLKSSMFLLILLKVKRFITDRFIKMIFTQWVYAHLGSGVAWEMDSLTNLPPVWFYRWQSYHPVGICPWYIYLFSDKSIALVNKINFVFHIHRYWIHSLVGSY